MEPNEAKGIFPAGWTLMLDGYGYYRTAEPTVTVFFAYFVFVAGLHDCFITSVDF